MAVSPNRRQRIQVVGDDYLVTSAERVRRAADGRLQRSAHQAQPGGHADRNAAPPSMPPGTAAWRTIISARSGETEDVTIVHLAVGWRSEQLKVGSFARSERMAKWNEALRIETQLGERSEFAGKSRRKLRTL